MFGRVACLTLALLVASLSGCGLFGRTKAQSIAPPAQLHSRLQVRPVALEPGQTHLQNVGTFAIGEYGSRDVEALTETIRATVAGATPPADAPAFDVHVVVRRFLVAHSNNEGFAVACVAWALTDATGAIRFHEQFYASDYVRLWGTIGGVKNNVHEGITRHIIEQAARVAAGEEPAPVTATYAHPSYEAATAGIPTQLSSVHYNAVFLGGGYSFRPVRIKGDSHRGWARRDDHIDWSARLSASS